MSEKINKKLKSLISFHSDNKLDNYNRRGVEIGGKKEKKRKNKSKGFYRKSQNLRIISVFLESPLSESFLSWVVTVHLTSLGCCPTLVGEAGCWPFLGSRSDSNLVLLLCVLASNVHSYQN